MHYVHYVPVGWPIFVAFWFLTAALVALIEIGILRYVFETMGINHRYMFALLAGCLLGSYINIPVASLPAEQVRSGELVDFFGVRYVVPVVVNWPGTIVAVNLGGAVIPLILSIYLVIKHGHYVRTFLGVAIVAMVIHQMARPLRGVGIAVPIFTPPLITAVVALSLSYWNPAPLAYIAGSMGTLIGADIMNLGKIRGLGAPVASIGGAGKFDGVFLTGILAMLLAGWLGRHRGYASKDGGELEHCIQVSASGKVGSCR